MKSGWRNPLLGLVLALPLAQAAAEEPLFNVVRLEARAEREIPNDEMTALLVAEKEGSDPAKLAEQINDTMRWALEQGRRVKDARIRTRNYQTNPQYNRIIITGWRASQELELRGTDFAALTELIGTLQQRLNIRQMSFAPTDATRKEHENQLIEEAMEAFHARVALVGGHMPQPNHRIVEINITTGSGQPPMPMLRAYAMAAAERVSSESAPAVEGGVSRLTVSVLGSVQFY